MTHPIQMDGLALQEANLEKVQVENKQSTTSGAGDELGGQSQGAILTAAVQGSSKLQPPIFLSKFGNWWELAIHW